MSYLLPSAWVIQVSAAPPPERMCSSGAWVVMSSVKERFLAVL